MKSSTGTAYYLWSLDKIGKNRQIASNSQTIYFFFRVRIAPTIVPIQTTGANRTNDHSNP
jgi:hypothetical protein